MLIIECFQNRFSSCSLKLEGSTYGDLFHLIVYKPNIIQIIEKIYAKNFHEPI